MIWRYKNATVINLINYKPSMWPISYLRTFHVEAAIGIILRVPGLMIIDYWWQHERNKSLPHSINTRGVFDALLTNLVLLHGFLLLLLPLKSVQVLYTHFVSFALVLSGHLLSYFYIHLEPGYLNKNPISEISGVNFFLTRQFTLLALQIILAVTASFLLKGPGKPHILFLNAFALPLLARLLNFPRNSLELAHNVASTIVAASLTRYIYFQIPIVTDRLKEAYHEVLITVHADNGWTTLFVGLWNKIFVANHFVVYWLGQFAVKLFNATMNNINSSHSYPNNDNSWSTSEDWYILVITIISDICNSPVSLLATAVIVSQLSHHILKGTKCFLIGTLSLPQNELEEISSAYSGWTEGLSLVLFSIQTGLMEMKMPSKIAVMMIILFLDFSTLMQSMLEMLEPVLLALGTSRSRNLGLKRLRVYSLCGFLFLFPLYLTHSFIELFTVDFWMVTLLSSCLLTSFQVIEFLIVHFLFMYDSWRQDPWDSLDDVVYYTRAFTKVLEFVLAIFVVAVGFFEVQNNDDSRQSQTKWNFANSTIVLFHCYVNIWQRLVAGWQSFNLRRKAVQRSVSLPAADEEKLKEKNDLCSICFTEMSATSANTCCITPCSHFFHRTCLRKWLYIRNSCPLCHTSIS